MSRHGSVDGGPSDEVLAHGVADDDPRGAGAHVALCVALRERVAGGGVLVDERVRGRDVGEDAPPRDGVGRHPAGARSLERHARLDVVAARVFVEDARVSSEAAVFVEVAPELRATLAYQLRDAAALVERWVRVRLSVDLAQQRLKRRLVFLGERVHADAGIAHQR